MAEELKTNGQVNYGWNLTWEATGKFPIVAKRIWKTLADAQAYVDDTADTACVGLNLTVVADPTAANNGIYYVASIGNGTTAGKLVKTGGDIRLKKITDADELAALGENVKEAYRLVDASGTAIADSDPICIYKESALQSVKLVEQKLQFTYELTDGTTSTVEVDLGKFLAESEFGNGLAVSTDGVVSVKLSEDEESATYLIIDEATGAVRLQGIKAIANDVANLKISVGTADDTANSEGSIYARLKQLKVEIDSITGESGSVADQIEAALNNYTTETINPITDKLAKKVDAVEGKGLSTEDYTTAEKEKLAGLEVVTYDYTSETGTLALEGIKARE